MFSELKEEVLEMKEEVRKSEEEKSIAYQLLEESKKQHKRDFIEKVILIAIIIITNLSWIIYLNQFDFTTEETTIDSGNGIATYIEDSNAGDISYGEN